MACLEQLRIYPVKGLDGITVEATDIRDSGTLAHDREFALFDANGDVINGKHTDRVHDLTTDFDPTLGTFTVETPDGETRQFVLESEHDRAEQWFSEFFDIDLTLRRDTSLGFSDRQKMGPSVISTASLQTVTSWFDEMTVEGARRRLRANIEISGVTSFWEDRFVSDRAPAFEVHDVRFEGLTSCGRCIAPQRDPDTGEPTPEFREQFLQKRQETFPDWADEDAFDHYYSLMILTRIPEADRGQTLRRDDLVCIVD